MNDEAAASSGVSASPAREVPIPFFPVSLRKLVIMTFCTFGLYSLYWQFCHWLYIRDYRGERFLPGARALFAIFFCYPLFRTIQSHGRSAGVPLGPPAGLLAIGWILFALCGYLPAPFFLLYFVSIVFLIPVQRAANAINKLVSPDHNPNGAFSVLNKVTIVAGGLLLIFTVIGACLPLR